MRLNMSDNSCRLFHKTNQYPSYINVNSNHTSSIIKQVPKAFIMRIRRLSSNKKMFHESCKMYIKTLMNSVFKEEFTYLELKMIKPINNIINNNNLYKDKETTDNCNIKVNNHKNRKRKIIWFNTPFLNLLI